MRILFALLFLMSIGITAFPQEQHNAVKEKSSPEQTYSYAYISVEGKLFSKKLKVEVDLGDSPEQLKAGREYSERLTNKKSYAAVLNHMVENDFELVETLDFISSYNGTGGTSGIVFIMRKKISR